MRVLPQILTEQEEKALLQQFNKRYRTSYRNRLMIEMALATGMRFGEVATLHWEDMEAEAAGVKVNIRKAKGKKDRVVYLKHGVYDSIVYYACKFNLPCEGLVFTTHKDTAVSRFYMAPRIKKAVQKAGIKKDIHFHSLRHTALTRFYNQSLDLRKVQMVAGHENIETTTIYTHISGADIKGLMLQ